MKTAEWLYAENRSLRVRLMNFSDISPIRRQELGRGINAVVRSLVYNHNLRNKRGISARALKVPAKRLWSWGNFTVSWPNHALPPKSDLIVDRTEGHGGQKGVVLGTV